jgi:hypothetical protein
MRLVLSICALFLFAACSSDSGGSNRPSSFFTRASVAASSSYTEIFQNSSIGATCTNGFPNTSSPGDPQFAQEDVFCILGDATSRTPDTIRGSFFTVGGILCAVEKSISFEFEQTVTTHNNIVFSERDECLGTAGLDLTGNGSIGDSVSIALLDSDIRSAGSSHDYLIQVQLNQNVYDNSRVADVEIYLKDSDGILGARLYQQNAGLFSEFVFSSDTDTFEYELRDYPIFIPDSGTTTPRHIRFSAQGSVSLSSGSVSRVDSARYIHAFGDSSTSSYSVIMNSGENFQQLDHHVNGIRAGGYSPVPAIQHNVDFYTWSGRSVTDQNPQLTPLLNLGVFNMEF